MPPDTITILSSPPHSHTSNRTSEKSSKNLLPDSAAEQTGAETAAGEASIVEESSGKVSRSCQTEASEQTWCTNESSAEVTESSLLHAIDRLCHEFSSGQSSHPEYVRAVRSILQPVVEQVLTEMHSKGKVDLSGL